MWSHLINWIGDVTGLLDTPLSSNAVASSSAKGKRANPFLCLFIRLCRHKTGCDVMHIKSKRSRCIFNCTILVEENKNCELSTCGIAIERLNRFVNSQRQSFVQNVSIK